MAIELVTGHAGQGHVSSADAGRLNAGICGAGKYVLDTGLKFAYSIESANLIRIASGDAVNQGRHITIPQNTYEDANILNGTQGKTRIDVITLRYSKMTRQVDSQTVTVEEASVNVIKGTEVAAGSTPEVPAVISGNIFDGTTTDDMPLYHVLITDTSVTSVTPVFSVLPNIFTLQGEDDDLREDLDDQQSALDDLSNTVSDISDEIGSVPMGTTAPTITGAIKEHEDQITTLQETVSNTKLIVINAPLGTLTFNSAGATGGTFDVSRYIPSGYTMIDAFRGYSGYFGAYFYSCSAVSATSVYVQLMRISGTQASTSPIVKLLCIKNL